MFIIPPQINLANGKSIPSIGFGTTSTEMEKFGDVEQAVKIAIDTGYRYIDTSRLYGNEQEVGQAITAKINEGVIKRDDIFVVNKIGCTIESIENIEEFCRLSLEKLGLEYFDLYLLHIPYNYTFKCEDQLFPLYSEPKVHIEIAYTKTWHSFELLVRKGLIKSIGIANCSISHLKRILSICEIQPVICHIECCPGFHQKKLIQYCKDKHIQVTAYCPLSRPDFKSFAISFNNDIDVQNMCVKYKKTPPQLILRYLYQIGAIPIPKSITKTRIQLYFHIFDFELTNSEMAKLGSFYKEERNIALEKKIFPMFPLRGDIKWKYGK